MRTAIVLVLAVLLAHAALLEALPGWPGVPDGSRGRVLQVRQIAAPPAPAPEAAAPVAPPPRRVVRVRPPAPAVATPEAAPAPAAIEPAPAPDPAPELPAAAAPTLATAEPAASAAGPEPAASAAPPAAALTDAAPAGAAADAVPTYATRLPSPASLRFELRRGVLTGEGELQWRPGPEGYELQIEGRAFGMPLLAWVSRGGIDAAGLAPERFVDRRRGRDLRAANFQRDKGVISYSTSSVEHPLLAGAQDRLSWMLQLAAIVEADPRRFVPGERVVMQVAGARADADLWAFSVVAREPVELVGARAEDALVLRREPRRPFDTVVEVWLDPARSHLPVRLKLATAGGNDALEFVLKP